MKTNHTPAPWFAVQYANCFDIQSEQGYCLNNVLDLEQDDNAEANARLIASAPELLEALQSLLYVAERWADGVQFPSIINAKEAIAKATGETINS
jgi:hypothetical protein